jgi:micrococcal nuclease
VVDGDTIDATPAVNGRESVRLIGVDTPESGQPYAEEASSFTGERLRGHQVALEFDVARIDPYNRLLAYVYLPDGTMFNETLVSEGYAQVATFPPNVKYTDRLVAAQQEARVAGRGLWGLPSSEQCELENRGNGIGEGTPGCGVTSVSASASASASATASATAAAEPSGGGVPPISEENCPPNAPIKGNADSGIYHTRSSATYDDTHPENCFATEAAAQAAGYRAARD